MLYSKNGSLPMPQTDGTEGWIEVPDAPVATDGKEVVWWYPPGWVVRDVKPEDRDGYKWSWSQSSEQWVEYPLPRTLTTEDIQALTSIDISTLVSGDIASLTTAQISLLG